MDDIAEANRIKDRLQACKTVLDVLAVADEERANVRRLAKTAEGKPLAVHIANLKAYMIDDLNQKGK